ncbi:hypothetical protein A1D23_02080 [Chelonobacter oris]|uniref:Uncharacterized protein n=1 Tax=Chelonobacter oris TaxID=505317 RepID=A0A0A3AN24_9PAST|nr:hypothetical protein OA57_04915 [Chelonobacter oris]MDH3000829.1 hypothetical protein [Chelonobacter oris]
MPFFDHSLIILEQLAKIKSAYKLISSPAFLRFLDDNLHYPVANVVFPPAVNCPRWWERKRSNGCM